MENKFRNQILKLALPITAQQFMLALVSACDAFMLGGLNQNSLSAVSLASQITFVFNLILTALTIGENMFVAQYYGKKDFDGLRTSAGLGNLLGEGNLFEARKSGNTLCKIAVFSGILTGGMILLLTPVILHFTNLTDIAGGYLKYMLFMSSYYVIGKSINSMTIGGIFPAGGDTKFGLKCDMVTMWCFAVPLGCIVAFVLKLPVLMVYFVLNLDELVKLPAVFKHYRQYKWVKNLTETEN